MCPTVDDLLYPPSDLQILDTSGIVESRDHRRLRAHSVINNRTGQSSGEGPKPDRCYYSRTLGTLTHRKSGRTALIPLNTSCING